MIDYKLKAKCIAENLHKKVKVVDNAEYIKYAEGIVNHRAEELYFQLLNQYPQKMIEEARKINTASSKRVQRLKNRIIRYISLGICTFITFTFDDEVLKTTTQETRRVYVRRTLKELSNYYLANIDYGIDDRYTHREHYHAVVVGLIHNNDQRLKWWHDNCGYTFTETIRTGSDDEKIIARYISKLTNHAIKESTRRCVYIYSRM